jgi:hypothetical protein
MLFMISATSRRNCGGRNLTIALQNKDVEFEFIEQLRLHDCLDFSDTLQCMSGPAETIERLEDGAFRT